MVGDFVQENRASLGRNIRGLNRVAKLLVRHREDLNVILKAGPLALNNLGLGYNPQAGTLDSNANIGNLFNDLTSDPAELLCALVSANDPDGNICDLINDAAAAAGTQRALRCRHRVAERRLLRPHPQRTRGGGAMKPPLRAGAVLLAGATLLTGCDFDVYKLPLPGGADVGDDPIEVKVEFEDVLDLVPKSSVKVSDVTVGQVTDVDLDGYDAVVTLSSATTPVSRTTRSRRSARPACSARSSCRSRRRRRLRPTSRSARATTSRSSAPAATPRSRKCSARSACCSTAAASPS